LADRPFALIGVSLDGDRATVKAVAAKHEMNWPTFWDGGIDGPFAGAWHVRAVPTVYLIDHAGVIRKRYAGPPGEKELEAEVGRLLAAAEAEKADDAVKAELKRLEGEWRIVAGEQGGRAFEPDDVVVFAGGKSTITNRTTKVVTENTFTIDPALEP